MSYSPSSFQFVLHTSLMPNQIVHCIFKHECKFKRNIASLPLLSFSPSADNKNLASKQFQTLEKLQQGKLVWGSIYFAFLSELIIALNTFQGYLSLLWKLCHCPWSLCTTQQSLLWNVCHWQTFLVYKIMSQTQELIPWISCHL